MKIPAQNRFSGLHQVMLLENRGKDKEAQNLEISTELKKAFGGRGLREINGVPQKIKNLFLPFFSDDSRVGRYLRSISSNKSKHPIFVGHTQRIDRRDTITIATGKSNGLETETDKLVRKKVIQVLRQYFDNTTIAKIYSVDVRNGAGQFRPDFRAEKASHNTNMKLTVIDVDETGNPKEMLFIGGKYSHTQAPKGLSHHTPHKTVKKKNSNPV